MAVDTAAGKLYLSKALACARTADSERRSRAIRLAGRAAYEALTIPFTIPESSDEQRLDDGSGGLGPLAYIFPSPSTNGFTRRSQVAAHGAFGMLVALVVVEDPQPPQPLPPSYQSLHLQTGGVNCIWLRQPNISGLGPYQAFVSLALPGQVCSRTDAMLGPLFVAESHPLNAHSDYPAAARFGEYNNQPLLGFKCPAGVSGNSSASWCEVAATPFTAQPPWASDNTREGRVKGWHDEQWLSVRNSSGNWIKQVRASLVPFPNLDRLDKSDFTGGWVRVARFYIWADQPTTKYYRAGLRAGSSPGATFNTVELRSDGVKWQMRISAPGPGGGQTIWTNVEEMPHLDFPVLPGVRFRMSSLDDGIWVPCGQSCCWAEID
jgi:hypothetical protein